MNYYKIVRDNTVIDVNHVFLRWQAKHKILLCCDAAEAQFIQSSDGEKVYRVGWLKPYPPEAGEFETVDAVEISKDEYIELREKLDLGQHPSEPTTNVPDVPEDGDNQPENDTPEEVMDAAAMRRAILELQERNAFLEDCLIEMSQVVYA